MIARRPATEADEAFFARVFADVRREEFAGAGLDPAAVEAFLRSQFEAQQAHYRRAFPGAERWVLRHADQDAGIAILNEDSEIRVVDLALLPAFRGQGIGTAILEELKVRAADLGVPVVLHVEMHNRARRLYERLGFRPVEDVGIYVRMEWRAEVSS